MEDWVTIRTMKQHNPNMGTRAIAKQLGIARNTVKRALKEDEPPKYERKECINPELEPFQDEILIQLCGKRLKGSRVLNDLWAKGCKVSKSAFYRHIRKLRDSQKRTYKRYETKPGEQAQFDWTQYSVLIDGKLTKIYIFSTILGFSRYRIYSASLSKRQSSIFEALEHALREIGGVPERIQTDNAGSLILKARPRDPIWNPRYLKFAEHFGFSPSRSAVGHPWSKGKVEEPFSYLENHFILDHEFASFEDFCRQLTDFQDLVNQREHSTTNVPPIQRFEFERYALLEVNPKPFIGATETFRKVTADCMISYKANRYSVPHIFARKEVWVRESQGADLIVYSQAGRIITTHKLVLGQKGTFVIKNEHFQGYRGTKGTWAALCHRFLRYCPTHQKFLDQLKAQKGINPSRHLTLIVEALPHFSAEAIEAVIEFCYDCNMYGGRFFVAMLHQRFGTKSPKSSILSCVPSPPRPPSPEGLQRRLDAYCTEDLASSPAVEEGE